MMKFQEQLESLSNADLLELAQIFAVEIQKRMPPASTKKYNVGDSVRFNTSKHHTVDAVVVKVNPKTLKVHVRGYDNRTIIYNVSPGLILD